jgi:hypothetical protein
MVLLVPWGKDLDLSNVSVSSTVLVLEDGKLYEHGLYVRLPYVRATSLAQFEGEPADRLFELNKLQFYELSAAVGGSNGNLLRCVGLICFEIKV